MSLVKLDLKPDNTKLKSFAEVALCMTVILSLLGAFLLSWNNKVQQVLLIAGLVIYLLSKISVKFVLPFYQLLMLVSFPIGWLISHLVFALFYYIIICPLGFFFKLRGRDSLQLKKNKDKKSFWIDCKKNNNLERYFQQF